MGLTKREVQEVTWKLNRADPEQRFTFLDAMDVNPSADRVFEQLKKQELACPDCAVVDEYRKHGTTEAGTQRYRCSACGRTFVEDWQQPTYRSNHSEARWKAFFERMIDGVPLVDLAQEFGLSYRCAFDWRHKLLSALSKVQDVELAGRVWADETFLNDNEPGRGAGHGQGKIAILTAQDHYGRLLIQPTSPGQGGSTRDIGQSLEGTLDYDYSTLVTDDAGNFGRFAREHGVEHESYSAQDHGGQLDLINYLHSHFKQWIKNFRGVGTKYLSNYCAWYKFVKKRRQSNPLRN